MSDRILSAEAVRELTIDCRTGEGETIGAGGIVCPMTFYRSKIEANHERIKAMLDELPEEFHAKTGGGWSFLNACVDRSGEQWTGLHPIMESLFCLGAAAGYVSCLLPRDLWPVLYGGMPLLMVRDERGEPEKIG